MVGILSMHSSNCTPVVSPLMAEALAVKIAISDTIFRGFKSLSVYSGLKVFLELVNSQSGCVEIEGTMRDIQVLRQGFEI